MITETKLKKWRWCEKFKTVSVSKFRNKTREYLNDN